MSEASGWAAFSPASSTNELSGLNLLSVPMGEGLRVTDPAHRNPIDTQIIFLYFCVP